MCQLPAATRASGLKKVLKGLGKVVVGALLQPGKSSAASAAPLNPGPILLPASVAEASSEDPSGQLAPTGAYFLIRSDVTRLLLADNHGRLVRVVVPVGASRTAQSLFLPLPPGTYSWVGYEEERLYTRRVEEDGESRKCVTRKIWRHESLVAIPFCVAPGLVQYGGSLEVWIRSISGTGAGRGRGSRTIFMGPHRADVQFQHWLDGSLAARTWQEFSDGVSALALCPLAAEQGRERDQDSGAFASPKRFEEYHRWLVRLAREAVPVHWPPLVPGERGPKFRLRLHDLWKEYVARQPRKKRRKVNLGLWLQTQGGPAGSALLASMERQERIRKLFPARVPLQAGSLSPSKEPSTGTAPSTVETLSGVETPVVKPVSWGRRAQ